MLFEYLCPLTPVGVRKCHTAWVHDGQSVTKSRGLEVDSSRPSKWHVTGFIRLHRAARNELWLQARWQRTCIGFKINQKNRDQQIFTPTAGGVESLPNKDLLHAASTDA